MADTTHAMEIFTIITIVTVLAALFGYLNVRFLKLPTTIGILLIAIVFSVLLFAMRPVFPGLFDILRDLVEDIDYREVILDIMLGFLLFAEAMHTHFDKLKEQSPWH